MSRIRSKDALRALQARHNELSQQHSDLARSRRQLLLKDALLQAWCDSMALMQLSLAVQEPAVEGEEPGGRGTKFQELLALEVQLLKQLGSSSSSGKDRSPLGTQQALEQLLTPEAHTISPATDPMAYLHGLVSQPPLQQALTMNAEDLARHMQQTTQQISIKLHQLDALPAWEREQKLKQISTIWDRYMYIHRSLIMDGKQDVVEKALSYNLETMQPDPAAAADRQAAQAAVLVPLLRLSEQQQEYIAVSMRLYYSLLAAIHQERQEINSSMTAADKPQLPSSSPQGAEDWQEQLQRQQDFTNRLDLLLHKEYKLRFTAMGFFTGALSYEQLSRLAVMSWPYPMRLLFLATEIMQQREKLEQQRLQLAG